MIKPSTIAPFVYYFSEDENFNYVSIRARYSSYDFKMTNLELKEWAKELLKVADELVDLYRESNPKNYRIGDD
jgi:uncharacterized protein YecE (DUF72 family)